VNLPLVARHGFVSGRVQGVAFRYYAQDQAHALGVDGWIRNLLDHRVEFHAQGPFGQVSAFLEWLHEGPPSARVQRVDVEEAEVDDALTGFAIKR